jgi:hypothetical protein
VKFREETAARQRRHRGPEAARDRERLEADHAGRLQIGIVNSQFVSAGGTYDEYSVAVKTALERGYVTMHPAGAYLSFTQEGADDLFA